MQNIRIYEATAKNLGPIDALRQAWQELYLARHVVWHLFLRDFLASFRQRLLGYFWIVLLPLVSMISFIFMQKVGILNTGVNDMPYPIFIYLGMTVWGLFINATTIVGNGLVTNHDLVVRTNIPKIALTLMGLATVYYNLLVNLLVLTVFLLLFQMMPSPWAVIFPIVVIPIMILGVGIGLILSVIGAVIRDATTMFTSIFTLVMYITPVIYKAQFSQPILNAIVRWNPLTYLVDVPRQIFYLGEISNSKAYWLATLFSLFVLWIGIYVFYTIKDKIAERL